MDSQIFIPSCDICGDITFFLDRYPCLFKPQRFENYRLNVYQEYLLRYTSNVLDQCKSCPQPEVQAKIKTGITMAKDVWCNSISNQKLFCQLDNCVMKEFINDDLIKIRDTLIEENPIGVLNFYYVQKIIDLNLPRCANCWSCLDFISNLEIVVKLITQEMTVKEAKKRVYFNNKADITDQLLQLAGVSTKPKFHTMKIYEKSDKKLVYLDSNIFMELEKVSQDCEFKQAILNSKKDYDYYYSPSHLEDILKRDLLDISVDPILSTIGEITEGLFIHRFDDTMRLDYELPQSSYKRTNNNTSKQITELVEKNHIESIKAGELFFPKYNTSMHKREINNKDLFGRDSELFKNALMITGATFNLNDTKNLDIKKIKYVELNDIIYKFLNAMDILNFRHEPLKNTQKLRSSVHDTEHLIYATYSDIFVTNDIPLYHRSKAILGHLTPNIQVMKLEEFLSDITRKK